MKAFTMAMINVFAPIALFAILICGPMAANGFYLHEMQMPGEGGMLVDIRWGLVKLVVMSVAILIAQRSLKEQE